MSFEDNLRSVTKSPQEIKQTNRELLANKLKQTAYAEVERFKAQCVENANKGLRSCALLTQSWINHNVTSNDFYGEDFVSVDHTDGDQLCSKYSISIEDEELFLNLLRNALLEEKFEKATIKNHSIYKNRTTYTRHHRLFKIKVKSHTNRVLFAERFCISTNW